jgi:hypothetical protein
MIFSFLLLENNGEKNDMSQSRKVQEIVESILYSDIGSLDHERGVIFDIFDIYGYLRVDEDDKLPSIDEIITKDFLDKYSHEILDKLPADNEYHKHINHLVLAALIIDKKAKMPQDLKERLLHGISWEAELKWRWRALDKEKEKKFLNERKQLIASFRKILEDYPTTTV